ncbi:MAG: hypothetical protein ACYDCQ_20790 [Dehalococcoidia bacterium]
MLLLGLAMCAAACHTPARPQATPRATPLGTAAATPGGGALIARAPASAVPADEIPACFVQDEPQAPPGNEQTQTFQPPPRVRPGATPGPRRPAPQLSQIAGRASFPLYVLAATQGEFNPVLLRESTAPAGNSRQSSLFAVQYRIPPQRGGGIAIVLSAPAAPGGTPARDDLDDGLDAVRIDSRLPGTPVSSDPLTDPGAALRRLGCPTHESVLVQVQGSEHPADLISWPGAPRVYLLRSETGSGEVTIETGVLTRKTLLALPGRLVDLRTAAESSAMLQAIFAGQPFRPVRTATPVPAGRLATARSDSSRP